MQQLQPSVSLHKRIPAQWRDHYLSHAQWADLYGRLLDHQAQLLARGERRREELREPTRSNDELDATVQRTERDRVVAEAERDVRLLRRISRALARLADGSYGYCEETGEPIGYARLCAQPWASLSLLAKEQEERRGQLYRS